MDEVLNQTFTPSTSSVVGLTGTQSTPRRRSVSITAKDARCGLGDAPTITTPLFFATLSTLSAQSCFISRVPFCDDFFIRRPPAPAPPYPYTLSDSRRADAIDILLDPWSSCMDKPSK